MEAVQAALRRAATSSPGHAWTQRAGIASLSALWKSLVSGKDAKVCVRGGPDHRQRFVFMHAQEESMPPVGLRPSWRPPLQATGRTQKRACRSSRHTTNSSSREMLC
jgi:hypothetical protein